MSDLTLGIDVSDAIARLAILDTDGETAARGIVAANRATSASSGDVMLDPIRVETTRCVPPQLAVQLCVELSTLGDDAVALGAARSLSSKAVRAGA